MTMAYTAPWRLQLQPGSFRDIPFGVKSVQTEVGRRVALHEYPQRDSVYPEDLGLQADKFTIEAIIVGPDYLAARDALIGALKMPGPGTLIHPYYGQRTVSLVSPARIAESPEEGGLARFSLDFVNAGDNTQPTARVDTQGAVEEAADDALEAIAEDFELSFSLDGLPEFSIAGALAMVDNALATINAAIDGLLAPVMSVLTDTLAAVQQIAGNVIGLLRAPALWAARVIGLAGAIADMALSPFYALQALRRLFDYGGQFESIDAGTPVRQREQGNQTAQATLIRRAALIEGARAASRLPLTGDGPDRVLTYDAAAELRDELAARLGDEAAGLVPAPRGNESPKTMLIDVPDPVYQALIALRAALVRDLTERAVNAPRVIHVSLPVTLPALVAAYRLHHDATRADELIARNARLIRHPGFVPGGVSLETIA
jgi:prophage DNA circulation protein